MPILLFFRKFFSRYLAVHFSVLLIYARALRFFNSRGDIEPMKYFIVYYLQHFGHFYSECNELYSTHALYYLFEQVYDHDALAFQRYERQYESNFVCLAFKFKDKSFELEKLLLVRFEKLAAMRI